MAKSGCSYTSHRVSLFHALRLGSTLNEHKSSQTVIRPCGDDCIHATSRLSSESTKSSGESTPASRASSSSTVAGTSSSKTYSCDNSLAYLSDESGNIPMPYANGDDEDYYDDDERLATTSSSTASSHRGQSPGRGRDIFKQTLAQSISFTSQPSVSANNRRMIIPLSELNSTLPAAKSGIALHLEPRPQTTILSREAPGGLVVVGRNPDNKNFTPRALLSHTSISPDCPSQSPLGSDGASSSDKKVTNNFLPGATIRRPLQMQTATPLMLSTSSKMRTPTNSPTGGEYDFFVMSPSSFGGVGAHIRAHSPPLNRSYNPFSTCALAHCQQGHTTALTCQEQSFCPEDSMKVLAASMTVSAYRD